MKNLLLCIILFCINISYLYGFNAENSIIDIVSTNQDYNWYSPWEKKPPQEINGSGVIIDNKYILTLASLLRNSAFVEVTKKGIVIKYPCKIIKIDYGCDLALLSPQDTSFFSDMESTDFSNDFMIDDKINMSQWNFENKIISVEGKIIDNCVIFPIYGYCGYDGFKISIILKDSNKQGDIISNSKGIIGMSVQSSPKSTDVSCISGKTINQFLERFRNGDNEGFAFNKLNFIYIDDNNFRSFIQIPDTLTGIVIVQEKGMPYADYFEKYDILTNIDGKKIDNNGFYWNENKKLDFRLLFNEKKIGKLIKLKIFRKGIIKEIELKLESYDIEDFIIPSIIHDKEPNYLFYGGLVFIELTAQYFEAWNGEDNLAPPPHLQEYYSNFNMKKKSDTNRLVVLHSIFNDEINLDYSSLLFCVFSKVNGKKIKDIEHIKTLLAENGEYDVFEFENTAMKAVFKKDMIQEKNNYLKEKYFVK